MKTRTHLSLFRWSNFSLRIKILIVMALPVVALLASSTSFLIASHSEHDASDAAARAVAIRQATNDVKAAIQAVDNVSYGALFGFDAGPAIAEANKALAARLATLRSLVNTNQRSLLLDFEDLLVKKNAVGKRFLDDFVRSGKLPHFTVVELTQFATVSQAPISVLDAIDDSTDAAIGDLQSAAQTARSHVVLTVALATAVGVVGGLLLMVFALSGIIRRIRLLGDNARRLAAGDELGHFPDGRDEIATLARELETAGRLLVEREDGMRKAAEEAERANRAKSEFLSRMSHELRTPLNSILGFGQVIAMGNVPPENREDVKLILRAGKHLLALIDEVLDISRIEAGEFRYSMEPVRVSDVVEEVLELAEPIASPRRIELFSSISEDVWVLADKQRLKQVLLNLVANGVKFNHDGGSVQLSSIRKEGGTHIHVTGGIL